MRLRNCSIACLEDLVDGCEMVTEDVAEAAGCQQNGRSNPTARMKSCRFIRREKDDGLLWKKLGMMMTEPLRVARKNHAFNVFLFLLLVGIEFSTLCRIVRIK